MINKEQLLKSLAHGWPDSPWSLPSDFDCKDFDALIIWHDPNSPHPKLKEIEDHYKSIGYIDDRKSHYPSIEQQLDMMFDVGYEGWKGHIAEIKRKYPKPDGGSND